MDDERRFVFREETFNDLAVRELAKSRAACLCKLQFGRCKSKECKACAVYKEYMACQKQMSDYDKTRLDTYVSKEYVEYSKYPERWLSYNGLIKYTIKWVCVGMICLTLICLMLISLFTVASTQQVLKLPFNTESDMLLHPDKIDPSENPELVFDYSIKDNKTPSRIKDILYETQKYIRTVNNDINWDYTTSCIDYALCFKLKWDEKYNPANCIIVWNKQPHWAHLFVGVFDPLLEDIILVEPQATDINKYMMQDNWDSRYKPYFNKYNYTTVWLKQVKNYD